MMKKIREEEKKNYQTQIDKIKQDMEIMKLKFVNKQMDCDNLLLKYKNIFKSISNQCKAKGIKLSVNFQMMKIRKLKNFILVLPILNLN